MFFALIFQLAGMKIIDFIYGIDLSNGVQHDLLSLDGGKAAFRILQILSSIGGFVVGSIFFALLRRESPMDYLGFKELPDTKLWLPTIVLMLCILPFSSELLQWSQQIKLPESLKDQEEAMRKLQESYLAVQSAYLKNQSFGDYLFNILFMALLPAFAEELFFRKAMLRVLYDLTRRVHLSIFISAMMFGLLHSSLFNMPVLVLFGILFGYLAYWSGSFWLAVAAHFTNNFVALSLTYWHQHNPEISITSDHYRFPIIIAIISLLLTISLVYYVYKNKWKYGE